MNYGELKQEILDLGKLTLADTVGARIAKFVARAESMIAEYVRALEMVSSGTIAEGQRISGGIYTLPTDFLKRLSVYGTENGTAYQVEPASLGELRKYSSSAPAFWHAIYGGRIEFRGAPASGASFDLIYFARPAVMTGDYDVRALLTAHESLYIHGALAWLYADAHNGGMSDLHTRAFHDAARAVNQAAKEATAAGVVAMPYNFASRSAM